MVGKDKNGGYGLNLLAGCRRAIWLIWDLLSRHTRSRCAVGKLS